MSDKIQEVKLLIKRILESKNMTIYQLSLKSGVSEACIRNWYSDRNYTPNLESLEKVCLALGISLSQLFIGSNESLYPIDDTTKELIESWLILDKHKQQLVIALMKELKK